MRNNQFYALMPDNTVKLINLDDGIVDDIKSIFVKGAKQLEPVDSKGTKFTGDYVARAGEDVFYVEFTLPDNFKNIPNNQADISVFDIGKDDSPKCIFYYDEEKYYFQVFNRKNMLQRKTVLHLIETENKFAKINESAFIVDDKVHAIYKEGRLYFNNYTLANQIFSLKEFLLEATDTEIDVFGNISTINVNVDNLKTISNIKTRRLIKQLTKSQNIGDFVKMQNSIRNEILKRSSVKVTMKNGKIELPTSNVAELNRVLEFLNEDIFIGQITNQRYLTNSKKKDN